MGYFDPAGRAFRFVIQCMNIFHAEKQRLTTCGRQGFSDVLADGLLVEARGADHGRIRFACVDVIVAQMFRHHGLIGPGRDRYHTQVVEFLDHIAGNSDSYIP